MKRTKTPDNKPIRPKDRVQPGTFLDAKIYQKAKIQAMTEGITTGQLIDHAILIYLQMDEDTRTQYLQMSKLQEGKGK